MKKIISLFCLMFFTLLFSQKQNQVIVSGKVLEKNTKQPLEYTTLVLTSIKNKQVLGGVTNAKGVFSVKIPSGLYHMKLEFIGFKTKILPQKNITKNMNLGTIMLSEDLESLDEVEIIAEKSTVEIKLDKKIYNVGKDMTIKGGNASDVLDNVPSVNVDAEGSVSLRGNENVRILIDGKPSALVGMSGTDALRNLPADAIQKVEVITSPSARYDAEGTAGILNIILRKGKITGFNGSVSLTTGFPNNHRIAANLNYRTKKINFFTNLGYSYSTPPGEAKFSATNYNEDQSVKSYLDQQREYDRTKRNLTPSFGLEYYINKKSSITGQFMFKKGNDSETNTNTSQFYNANRDVTATSIRTQKGSEKQNTYQYSLNYTNNIDDNGQKLNIDLQYGINNEDEQTVITADKIENNSQITDAKTFLLQLDYVLPFKNNDQLELGHKVDLVDTFSDFKVRDVNGNSFAFDPSNAINFYQVIYAYYAQYGRKINKFSYLFGLRAEQTKFELELLNTNKTSEKNYLEWFPTVNFGYEINDTDNISLGYSRRLRRPRRWFLNPFESRTSNTFIFKGNPDLDPMFTNSFDLGYATKIGKLNLTSSVYYQYSTQNIDVLSRLENRPNIDVPVEVHQPYNAGSENRYGAELNANYSPAKWARLSGSFNYFSYKTASFNYNYEYNGTVFNEVLPEVTSQSWFTRFSSRITLPAKIQWQTRVMYRAPQELSQSKREGMFSTSLAFSKDLFKEKATISFNVSDLFNSRRMQKRTFNPNRENPRNISDLDFQWRQRQFTLNFTYRFNQKKKRGKPKGSYDGGGEGGF